MGIVSHPRINPFELPKGRFKSMTLEKMTQLHDINSYKLLEEISIADNKLDKIAGDYTITDAQKILLSKKVYEENGKKVFNELLKVLGQLGEQIDETEAQFTMNKLRAKTLTEDQKTLLPMIKEKYLKDSKIPDNENYQRALIFLSDNGLIDSNILPVIEAKTPKEIRDKAKSLRSVYSNIDNIGVSYAEMVEANTKNATIENIELHKYEA